MRKKAAARQNLTVKERNELWERRHPGRHSAPCEIPWCSTVVVVTGAWAGAHVLAVAKGGPNVWSNYRITCVPCNLSMGVQSITEWSKKHAEDHHFCAPMELSTQDTRQLLLAHFRAIAAELTTSQVLYSEDIAKELAAVQDAVPTITMNKLQTNLGCLVNEVHFMSKARIHDKRVLILQPLGFSVQQTLQAAAQKRPYSPSGFVPPAVRVKQEVREVQQTDNNGNPTGQTVLVV